MTTFFCNNKMLEESVRTLYIQLLNTYIYIYIKNHCVIITRLIHIIV